MTYFCQSKKSALREIRVEIDPSNGTSTMRAIPHRIFCGDTCAHRVNPDGSITMNTIKAASLASKAMYYDTDGGLGKGFIDRVVSSDSGQPMLPMQKAGMNLVCCLHKKVTICLHSKKIQGTLRVFIVVGEDDEFPKEYVLILDEGKQVTLDARALVEDEKTSCTLASEEDHDVVMV